MSGLAMRSRFSPLQNLVSARPWPSAASLRPRRPCGCKGGGRSRFAVGRLRRRLWGL